MIKTFRLRDALFSFVLLAGIAHADPATLNEVSITATPDKARINISFSKTPSYKVFSLPNPPRLVIDLHDTDLKAKLDKLILTSTPLNAIRSGPQPNHGLRIVVDLKKPLAANSLTTTADHDGHHLTIEIGGPLPAITQATTQPKTDEKNPSSPEKPTLPAEKEKSAPKDNLAKERAEAMKAMMEKEQLTTVKPEKPAEKAPTPAKPVTQSVEPVVVADIPKPEAAPKKGAIVGKTTLAKPKNIAVRGTRDVVVVIDPGHGGKDSGAKGANGTYEKNVVLAISKKLQQLIQQEPGMRAVLTRKGDYFIGLRERLRIARKDKADLFIAIHADAFTNPNSSGASVFALSATGASSEAARWIAEKENYSELGGIPLTDKSDLLRSVLIDLSQTGIISLSLQLGNYLISDLGKVAHLHHGSVEQARFVVLKSLDIPSVLVETGFISNEQEERRLNDPLYQQQVANALFKGIRNYFRQYPPPGTRIAAMKDSTTLAQAD